MKKLIAETVAYRIYRGDLKCGRLSHAYLLSFGDAANLRAALKLFAGEFFGAESDERAARLIACEGLPDLKIYPAQDKKLTAADAAEIVADSAIKPVERDSKLYVISDFNLASDIVQNKLLKVLEEPPQGVYFLLGATNLSPVLSTVLSRVKLLEIPPFTPAQICSALSRSGIDSRNEEVANSCGGVLGVAQNMLSGGWYDEVKAAARDLFGVTDVKGACAAAVKYGDFKYKNELLGELQREYYNELVLRTKHKKSSLEIPIGAVIYAVEELNRALADVRLNANFSALLYDFSLGVALRCGG